MNELAIKYEGELSKDQQIEVVKQLAEFKSIPDVREFIKTEYGKDLAYGSVQFYLKSKKWKPMLERMREEFVAPIMSIPVAHKYIRLSRLEDLYQKTVNGSLKEVDKIRECRELMSEARAEIEGSKGNKTGDMFLTQINNFSDDELRTKKDTILNRLKAIDVGNPK